MGPPWSAKNPGKWLELLMEAAPQVKRVAIVHNPQLNTARGSAYVPSIDAVDIVRAIDAFAAEPNGGLIVLPPTPTAANRQTIFRLAAGHRLPAVYSDRSQAGEGGLMAYGSVPADRFRRAASFVDRILRGAKVSELPVEFPTKFELVINMKTAKALGLTIPKVLLASADEVIE
jgi:putative ABC transport system substrate-binding protein